jgi:hypothetical protein
MYCLERNAGTVGVVQATSRLRSWPVIVVALVAVFGIGLGIGVAVTHGRMSAKVSAAQDAERRAQQGSEASQRQALQARQLAKTNAQHAETNAQLAQRQAQLIAQQATWMRACDNMYSGAQESAVRVSCIAAVRKGVSPETFRHDRGA